MEEITRVFDRCNINRFWRVYGRTRQRGSLHCLGNVHEFADIAFAFDYTGCWKFLSFSEARNGLIPVVPVARPSLAVMDGRR